MDDSTHMDNWRLSRIEEELNSLDIDAYAEVDHVDVDVPEGFRDSLEIREEIESPSPPPPPPTAPPDLHKEDKEIYSKVGIYPIQRNLDEDGVRKISDKYDSLGKVRAFLDQNQYQYQPEVNTLPKPPRVMMDTKVELRIPPKTYRPVERAEVQEIIPDDEKPKLAKKTKNYYAHQIGSLRKDPFTEFRSDGTREYKTNSLDRRQMAAMKEYIQRPPADHRPISATTDLFASNPILSQLRVREEHQALTEQDILQVEMFYRSHKTEVFVCQCSATMYFGKVPKNIHAQPPTTPQTSDEWTLVKRGVLVLLLDSGESRRHRKLSLLLSEIGTGFMLWRDGVNNLSNYRVVQSTFHTMHLSNDHTRYVGFQFDDASAAGEFVLRLQTLTSDPDDSINSLSGKFRKKKNKKDTKKGKYKAPAKSEISAPCCFQHVTNLDRNEGISIANSPAASPSHLHSHNMRLSPVKNTPVVTSLLQNNK